MFTFVRMYLIARQLITCLVAHALIVCVRVARRVQTRPKDLQGDGYDVQICTRNRCAFIRVCTSRRHHDVQRESLSTQARKRLHNVLIAARWLAQTVQNIGNARRVFFPSSSPPGGPRTFWITSGDGRMAPLRRTPPGEESRAIIAHASLWDGEECNMTKEQVTEADVRRTGPRTIVWPLVVDEGSGKFFS